MLAAERNGYKPSIAEDICRWAYSFVLVLIIPIAFLMLMLRGKTKNKAYNRRRFERFGFVAHAPASDGYLFHCVSVGEVVAASCLIKRLMRDEPGCQITVTTTTPTGSARVRAIFGDSVHHFYLPYDLHMAMAGMLKRVKPKAVLITEVELWPNLIHACWKRKIPVMVINARMTDRSAKRYKKISKLFRPMLSKLSHVCAQGERDFNNYQSLGVSEEKLTLTNNIKFDQVAVTQSSTTSFMSLNNAEYPVLVAGSTHESEEAEILKATTELWKRFATLKVVIVPRHPERFNAVAKLIEKTAHPFVRSSTHAKVPDDTNIILLDEMGKLNDAYAVASFAFVGGSIANKGGHNALEPASFSVPIMMGPYTYNNPVICDYLKASKALTIVRDGADIVNLVSRWIEQPALCLQEGRAGRKVLDDNSGALEETMSCIRKYVV